MAVVIKVGETEAVSVDIGEKVYIQGDPGFSPTIEVTDITGGHRLTITDINGDKTVDVMNGAKGDTGATGNGIEYITLNADYTLTVHYTNGTEWTSDSIRGEKGDKGDTGDTGATFQPSVSEEGDLSWTNDKGKPNPPTVNIKGPEGQPGPIGPTPDISIGTVTTGAAGSQAEATMTGTPERPVLNLTIPRGDPGEVTQAEFDELSQEVTNQKSVLNGELYGSVVDLGTLIKNEYVTAKGVVAPYGGWDRTDYIDVTDIVSITYNHNSVYCCAYKDDYNFNGQLKLKTGIAYLIPAGTKYIMISDTATNMATATVTALKQTTITKLSNSVESMETAINTISTINATNIYNKSYVNGSTGAILPSWGWIASRFIELDFTPFNSITVSGSFKTTAGCAFYDEDYNYIINSGIDGNNISQYSYSGNPDNYCTVICTIPNNAKYIRISGKAAYISETQPMCITGNTFSGTYPKINKNAAKIKVLEALVSTAISESKVLVIGDSISTDAYGSYPKWVTDLINTGFLPADTTNSSQHATGFVARYDNQPNDFITRLKAIQSPETYDLVVVFGGINDYIQNIPMGSESGTDYTVSFKPAVNEFFNYLIQNFTQARLCVLLPLRTYATWTNSVGEYQQAYGDYIKQVAKSYCLPVLNLTEDSGFCPYISTFSEMWTLVPQGYQSGDGVHPNEEYERRFLAPMIKHFLQGLM